MKPLFDSKEVCMKFKGFWTSYWDLFKHSIEWLKDYCLAYTILMIVFAIFWFLPGMISAWIKEKKSKKGFHPEFE